MREDVSERKNYRSYLRYLCGSFLDLEYPTRRFQTDLPGSHLPPTNLVESKRDYYLEFALAGYK